MLTVGRRYRAAMALPTFDSDELVPQGALLVALTRDGSIALEQCSSCTAPVYQLMPLQANRPDWFLQQVDGFNPPPVTVPTLKELAFEAVRAYPDLMREELYSRLMACNPRLKRFTIDTLSGALSDDVRIEMFKEGVRVEEVGHNQRYCTFRPRGWAPALPQAAE